MKFSDKISFLFLALAFSFSYTSIQSQDSEQTNDIRDLMYKAAVLNSELLWDRSVSTAKSNFESSKSSEDLLQLCYAYYGRVGHGLSKRKIDKDKGEDLAELGLASSKKLSLDPAYESIANSLLAGFNGMSIAMAPMKGMFLGPKSDKQVNKSLKLDPSNPIAWLQKGSSQFNTPRIFGGSPKKSIESFKKSIDYFEADESKPVWMKIEAMIWLGQAYHYVKEYERALETYHAILDIESDHKWVKDILLPATISKIES